MSQGASNYPITQFITSLMSEYGLSRVGFIRALGYHNPDRGLRRLNLWLETGEGYDRILDQIAAVYPGHSEQLQKAVAETSKAKRAEVEAAFLERCKAEESTFIPFIHVDGESRIPNGITVFGISGGHARWTTIRIPEGVLRLPLEGQLVRLPRLMAAYQRKYNASCPFFGKLTGFKFVRLLDYFQFDSEGNFVGHVEKPFRTGYVEVFLR